MNVVLIIFNRPDLTARVCEAIAVARPDRLFIVADGPRDEAERLKCEHVRSIAEKMSWPCEVHKNYSEINLGSKKRVTSGIDWVFTFVDDAIILEDDCLPDPSFFPFCEELLERYRNNPEIGLISGTNFVPRWLPSTCSYMFSEYGGTWGWATWRRAWRLNDPELKRWPPLRMNGWHYKAFSTKKEAEYFRAIWDDILAGGSHVWDYQWFFCRKVNNLLSVIPAENLVTNIGFTQDATWTTDETSYLGKLHRQRMKFPLRHQLNISLNHDYDVKYFNRVILGYRLSFRRFREVITNTQTYRRLLQKIPFAKKLKQNIDAFVSWCKSEKGGMPIGSDEKARLPPCMGYDLEDEARELITVVRANTMLTYERLVTLYQQVVYCENNGIHGAYVECGTWKGGAVGLMALANMKHSTSRRHLHLFDSFEGICEPDADVDGARALEDMRSVGGGTAGRLIPVKNFYETHCGGLGTFEANQMLLEQNIGYDPTYIHYHKGWFQETMPVCAPHTGDIAILRIDGDWYASTKVCLEHLFKHVVKGGFIIIDDYGYYEGCRKAVQDFLTHEGITPYLNHIDAPARYWIKN